MAFSFNLGNEVENVRVSKLDPRRIRHGLSQFLLQLRSLDFEVVHVLLASHDLIVRFVEAAGQLLAATLASCE